MAGRFSVETVFRAVDRITAPVSRMQNRIGKFTRSVSDGARRMQRSFSAVGKSIKSVGRNAAVGLGLVTAALAPVIATGAEFEQAITNVGAVSMMTRDQIGALEEMALSLGRTTKFTATQSANAMEIMARAGFTINDIMAATPAVLSAAAASGIEIAEVADHVSNVLKGMGLATSEAARVADVLALASSRTNSSIGSLGESMRNVADTASTLNIPLEDVVASVALLQDVGLDASVAGSAFNTMLTKMADPSKTITSVMRRLGISFKDAKGDMKTLPEVLKDIDGAANRMGGNFDKIAFLTELVGLRGQKAAGNLSKMFANGKIEELTAELLKAKGAADEMAAIRMNTFQGSMLLLGSAVDAVKVKIFGLQSGPLKDLVDGWTDWVGRNEDLVATNIAEFIGDVITGMESIVKWTKRLAVGLAVFFTFNAVLQTFIGIMTAVNLVMALNPIGLIVLAIAGAIAGMTLLVTWIDTIIEKFDKMPAVLRVAFAPLRLIMGGIKYIKDNFSIFTDAASSLFGGDEDEGAARADGFTGAAMISPQERVARSIEETTNISRAEIIVKDEGNKAEVINTSADAMISLAHSGGF